MAYLSVSRELLNGSFWGALASAEKGIILDLIAMAPMEAYTVSLYGLQIPLEPYEICFSAKIMAKKFNVTVHVFRNLIDKLSRNNIGVKKRRQISHTGTDTLKNSGSIKNNNTFFTSLTFYPSVFGIDPDKHGSSGKNSSETIPEATPKPTHNQELTDLKEEEVFTNARGENFQNYENRTIHFADKQALQEVIPEKSVAYFCESYECRTQDLENLFGLFIRREEASGLYFLRHKELQRRFAYFLEKNYQTKLTHAKKSKHNGNIQQQPEKQREKSEYEKRREAEDAAIIARMPRYGGSSAGLHAIGKRERRYGTKGTE